MILIFGPGFDPRSSTKKINKMKINKEHLQIMLSWIRGENIYNKKPNTWDWLLINTTFNTDEYIDVDDVELEKILLESIRISKKVNNVDIFSPILDSLNIDKKLIDNEVKKLKKLTESTENFILNNDFNNEDLNNEKLDILKIRLENYIKSEEYEKCGDLVKSIKDLENYLSKA
jgi:hypothetical protein